MIPGRSWSAGYAAPENETQRLLCDAFCKALDLQRAGIHDDFFRLGGDSVRVMMLLRLCPLPGLSTRLVHECRTPEAIARCLSETQPDEDSLQPGAIPSDPVPLTQAQLGIFLSCEKQEGKAVYNNPMLLKFPAQADEKVLARAVRDAVAAHPGLLSRLVTDGDGIIPL